MRTIVVFCFVIVSFSLFAQSVNHSVWDQLVKKNVSTDGRVNYKGFIEDRKSLESYLDMLTKSSPSSTWPKNEQLAFWINAYNAFTVKLIVDHYPLESIKDLNSLIAIPTVNTIWQKKFFRIGKKELSLDDIEHTILRKQFEEPRIHFAINCASVSCPILRNEAYVSSRLEDQLQQQAKRFINDRSKNKITTDKVELSQVFNWFVKDFTRQGTLLDYINQFSDVKASSKAKVSFIEYDWRLNE